MPEMTVTVRWPDGRETSHYSPSLVLHDHLKVSARYPVPEFVARTRTALHEADLRVQARYGFICTSARQSQADVVGVAADYAAGEVEVLAMEPALADASP